MNGIKAKIADKCPLFVCRVCRTKVGWKHQNWCEASGLTAPGCPGCLYHNKISRICGHPANKRKERFD